MDDKNRIVTLLSFWLTSPVKAERFEEIDYFLPKSVTTNKFYSFLGPQGRRDAINVF